MTGTRSRGHTPPAPDDQDDLDTGAASGVNSQGLSGEGGVPVITPEQARALREPFPPEMVGQLPKGGTQLDYVGHAAVTDRLLKVDPCWSWEPVAFDMDGAPLISTVGKDAVLWIRLTVCGVTRLGVGTAPAGAFDLPKQLVSDALRNAAMRFGVALDLWSKEDLHAAENAEQARAEQQKRVWLNEAKGQVLEAVGGDKDAAAGWWREHTPSSPDELEALLDRIEQEQA